MSGGSHHGGRKLVSTRSNPQLGPLVPLLNQIHEESEEGANSPAADTSVADPAMGTTGIIEKEGCVMGIQDEHILIRYRY